LRITHPEIMDFAALRAFPSSLCLDFYSLQIKEENTVKEEMRIAGTPREERESIRHKNFRIAILKSELARVKMVSTKVVDNETVVTVVDRHVLGGLDVTRYLLDNWNSVSFGNFRLGNSAVCMFIRGSSID